MRHGSDPVRGISVLINLLPAQLFLSSTWPKVMAGEQEHTQCVCVRVVDASYVHVSVFLSACMYVDMFVCSAVAMCSVKVSSRAGSRPSCGSSADFAELLVSCHAAHPMTSFNENWYCLSTVCVFMAHNALCLYGNKAELYADSRHTESEKHFLNLQKKLKSIVKAAVYSYESSQSFLCCHCCSLCWSHSFVTIKTRC